MNMVVCCWVFKTKLWVDGGLEYLKARRVAKGFNQKEGVNFSKTFTPIIKPGIILNVLTIATMKGWPVRLLDVKNAFLHGHLQEPVYME